MSVKNLYTQEGFFWWVGVVEDRNDPLFLGRCKVRIFGYHNTNTADLPTSDLPWCSPIQPITSPAISGKGTTPLGPVEGTWVVGFFLDGEDCQQPVMFGTISGAHQKETVLKNRNTQNKGFQDPNKKYPLEVTLDSVDTNKLALGLVKGTIIPYKNASRTKKIELPFTNETWEEPEIRYKPSYPFNHVYESESGHVIEIDDTPGIERIHIYHKTGSYIEIDPSGTSITKVKGNDYKIVDKNGNISITGKANITIGGDANIKVNSDCNIEAEGNIKVHSHASIEIKSANDILLAAGKNIELQAGEKFNVRSNEDSLLYTPKVVIKGFGGTNLIVGGNISGASTTVLPTGTAQAATVNPIEETEYPEEIKNAVDVPLDVSYVTAPFIVNDESNIINQTNPIESVSMVSETFPFDTNIPVPTPIKTEPLGIDDIPVNVSTALIVELPAGSRYIRDDSVPQLSGWPRGYDSLKRRGWAGRRLLPMSTSIKISDIRSSLEPYAPLPLCRVIMAIMLLEQRKGSSIVASHYNYTGVDITASNARFNPSYHIGWNLLTEGNDTGLKKAYVAFAGYQGFVNYMKSQLTGTWLNPQTADSFAILYYTRWNGLGMRLTPANMARAKAINPAADPQRDPLGSPAWKAIDDEQLAKAKRAWQRTYQDFEELGNT